MEVLVLDKHYLVKEITVSKFRAIIEMWRYNDYVVNVNQAGRPLKLNIYRTVSLQLKKWLTRQQQKKIMNK